MSTRPLACVKHVWGPWTSEERTNAAGEKQYVLERLCYGCGVVEVEPAMVQEPPNG